MAKKPDQNAPEELDQQPQNVPEGPEVAEAKEPEAPAKEKVISQAGPWKVQRAPVTGADCR